MDYKNAGVDIEAGYESVELMKKFVKGTMRPEVLGGLGGFSGAFSLDAIKNMEDADFNVFRYIQELFCQYTGRIILRSKRSRRRLINPKSNME